jgi:electron transport complex protein RnfA
MDFAHLFGIAISMILINNFVLAKFIGLCPFFGVSKKLDSAIGMGLAVIFVLALATLCTWTVQYYVLVPLKIDYLQTIAFILIIAGLVQFVEMFLLKNMPALYKALGIYLPLITTNCAVLGVAVLNITEGYNFIESMVQGVAVGMGFTLALVLMAGVRERLEYAKIPKAMQGMPIAFVSAGLMALAFLGFAGLRIG